MQLHGKLGRTTKILDCAADKVGLDKLFCRVLLFYAPVTISILLRTHLPLPLRYAICSNSQNVREICSPRSKICV